MHLLGEYTRYLGAWLTNRTSDENQIERLDKIIKNVVQHINKTRASYAVCRYVAQAKIGGSANYVMRFTNIKDSKLKEWDNEIHIALMKKAVPPTAWNIKGTQAVQTEEWGPDAISLEAMYKAIQIENMFNLMNTDTAQAQLFKDILGKYSRTRGYEDQCLHRPQNRNGKVLHRLHKHTIMVAIENALATLQWKVQMPGVEGKTNSEQISDYLTDAERNEHWPTMWRHRIWRTEQWKQEDKRERSHHSLTVKKEQEQRKELIRRAVELQELDIGEDEERHWEEAVQQILKEAEGLPGQEAACADERIDDEGQAQAHHVRREASSLEKAPGPGGRCCGLCWPCFDAFGHRLWARASRVRARFFKPQSFEASSLQ